jgi:hypothetical protein
MHKIKKGLVNVVCSIDADTSHPRSVVLHALCVTIVRSFARSFVRRQCFCDGVGAGEEG